MPQSTDLLQGTLDLLILQTLALEPMHGWVVAQRTHSCQKTSCRSGRVLFIRRFIALNMRVGSDRNGGSQRLIGGQSFIVLPQSARSNQKRNWPPGIACPRRSDLFLAGSQRRPHDL